MLSTVLVSLLTLALGVAIGWLVASSRASSRLQLTSSDLQRVTAERDAAVAERSRADSEIREVRQRIETEQKFRIEAATQREEAEKKLVELTSFVESSKKQLEGSYAKLSNDALSSAIEKLVQVVKPHLDGNKGEITSTLDTKKVEIEGMLQPLREMLDKYQEQLQKSEKSRVEAYAGIQEQVRQLMSANEATQREASKLASALRVPNVRGSWGETTLRNCIELAGMSEFCDFTLQTTVENDEGRRFRPDLVVRLPNNRVIAVDSKAPFDAYLEATATDDESRKRDLLDQHARNLRRHIEQLSRKDYQASVGETLDFTVLFLGGEQFLSSALLTDPTIFEFAISRKIYLASPTVLLPLLRAVAAGWKAERAEENAKQALEIGLGLYERFVKVFEHIEPVGSALETAIRKYNEAVRSVNSRLVPQAAKLQALVGSTKDLPELEQIDATAEASVFAEQASLLIGE